MSLYLGTNLVAGTPDITGKANTSLNNLDSTGQAVIDGKVDLNAANLSTAGKSLISGLGMPSSKYDNLTLGTTGTQYTAPANGYFIINYGNVPALQYFRMINNAKGYSVTNHSGSVTFRIDLVLPVLKGDIMQCDYNATGTIECFRFYYAEGEYNV